ncbi:MAG: SpoIIE family protein phosphatase [Butyrivibrio sp.]|nr:SpoIIE family protein phosphatase [Butyrivibrio sp.]
MLAMIVKMSLIVLGHVVLTVILWNLTKEKKVTSLIRIIIGVIYGGCAVLSTHFGVGFSHMVINVRDLGPMAAGLFFDPGAGIIAGLIGGIERYIAGTYFGVGSYTRIACSLSTCLSGFVAAALNLYIFKTKKPSATYAFFMGAVMEVFHMYVVFVTHRNDMVMAFYVVKTCAIPMIIFTGIGLALISLVIRYLAEGYHLTFKKKKDEEIKVSQQFQFWLFVVTGSIIIFSFIFSFNIQTQSAIQNARDRLEDIASDIRSSYYTVNKYGSDLGILSFHVGTDGTFDIINNSGVVVAGKHIGGFLGEADQAVISEYEDGTFKEDTLFGERCFCYTEKLTSTLILLLRLPSEEVYSERDAAAYESAFSDILLFAVIYVLISMLVKSIVVDNLDLVNESLNKITNGNLNETVSVYNSSEFASLSNDINQTVDVLKSYIEAAEKRIAEELEFARTIQESALPRTFNYPKDMFEIYATMDTAKEVGGDFYDFFFVSPTKLCMVMADVSGKGIPAALFMMRSKTAIKTTAESGLSPAEVLKKANDTLCEGNEADMFVTVWLGIVDLNTGYMQCANAGHEYPIIKREGGDFELYKDKHCMAVGAMEGLSFKEYDIQLNTGDTIFVYTDGIPEAINKNEEQFGLDRTLSVLNKNKDVSMDRLLPRVKSEIDAFVGEADQFDDVTMLGFKYVGKQKL